jgi:hypothetical protein
LNINSQNFASNSKSLFLGTNGNKVRLAQGAGFFTDFQLNGLSVVSSSSTWYHIAITFNRSSLSLSIYLQGILEVSGIASSNINFSPHGIYLGTKQKKKQKQKKKTM